MRAKNRAAGETEWQRTWNEERRHHESEGSPRAEEQKEDATMKAAGKLAQVAGKEFSRSQRKKVSPWIHYGFGTLMGGLYGMAMEGMPPRVSRTTTPFAGGIFGSALFLGADEAAVPALELSEKPTETPASKHLYAWVSHLVYGVTAETVRRGVRSAL